MTMTTTTYGAAYGDQSQIESIAAYISGDDTTTGDEKTLLADALFAALRAEVDELLPEDVSWQPATSDFAHPVDVEIPDREELREIFEAAWSAVEARYEQIERDTLYGDLPATVEELERALKAIVSPLHRARVAGLLADAGTARMAGEVRAEAVYQATRERTAERVADLLGTGVPAVRKLIKGHNARNADS